MSKHVDFHESKNENIYVGDPPKKELPKVPLKPIIKVSDKNTNISGAPPSKALPEIPPFPKLPSFHDIMAGNDSDDTESSEEIIPDHPKIVEEVISSKPIPEIPIHIIEPTPEIPTVTNNTVLTLEESFNAYYVIPLRTNEKVLYFKHLLYLIIRNRPNLMQIIAERMLSNNNLNIENFIDYITELTISIMYNNGFDPQNPSQFNYGNLENIIMYINEAFKEINAPFIVPLHIPENNEINVDNIQNSNNIISSSALSDVHSLNNNNVNVFNDTNELFSDKALFIENFFSHLQVGDHVIQFAPFLINTIFSKDFLNFIYHKEYRNLIRTYYEGVIEEGIADLNQDEFKERDNRFWISDRHIYYIQFGKSISEFKDKHNHKSAILTKEEIIESEPIRTVVQPESKGRKKKDEIESPKVIITPVEPKRINLIYLKEQKKGITAIEKATKDTDRNSFSLTTIYTNNDHINTYYYFPNEAEIDKSFENFMWDFIFKENSYLFSETIIGIGNSKHWGSYLIPLTFIELYLFNPEESFHACSNCTPNHQIIETNTWKFIVDYIKTVKNNWNEWITLFDIEQNLSMYQKMLIWFIFCIFFYGLQNLKTPESRLQILLFKNFIKVPHDVSMHGILNDKS